MAEQKVWGAQRDDQSLGQFGASALDVAETISPMDRTIIDGDSGKAAIEPQLAKDL